MVELCKAEEGSVPRAARINRSANPTADSTLLYPGTVWPGRNNGYPIMCGQVLIGGIHGRLIPAGLFNPCFEIIRHNNLRHSAQKLKGMYMYTYPVRQLWLNLPRHRCRSLPQDRRQKSGHGLLPPLRGFAAQALSRPVYKKLLACPVLLVQGHIKGLFPSTILLAKPAVLYPCGFACLYSYHKNCSVTPLRLNSLYKYCIGGMPSVVITCLVSFIAGKFAFQAGLIHIFR